MTAEAQIIPEDIHDAAMRAVDAAREDFLLAKASDNQANLRKVAIACVEKAILAERRRCLSIVEIPGILLSGASEGISTGEVIGPDVKAIAARVDLRMTCSAFPEQYDATLDGVQVGYLRLRHGVFTVEYPDVGGGMLLCGYPNGDGEFDDDERDLWLSAAKLAIARKIIRKSEGI